MKCPKCGYEFKIHKKLPELNQYQIKTLEICESQPRYGMEIGRLVLGDGYDSAHIRSLIRSLIKRDLLFPCKPNVHNLITMKDPRAKHRKYYTSNLEYAKDNPPKPLN